MQVNFMLEKEILWVALEGFVDQDASELIQKSAAKIKESYQTQRGLVVDFSKLRFVGSTCMSVAIPFLENWVLENKSVCFQGVSPDYQKMLRVYAKNIPFKYARTWEHSFALIHNLPFIEDPLNFAIDNSDLDEEEDFEKIQKAKKRKSKDNLDISS